MSSAGTVDLHVRAADAAAKRAGGALAIRQMSSNRISSIDSYSPGIAVRLVAAFGLLAILPIAAAIVGLLGVASVNQSLEELERTTLYFGIRDREFRGGAQLLTRVYSDPANFESPQALQQASREIDNALATMRRNLEDLVSRDMIESAGELIIAQRSLEVATSAALQIASQRLRSMAGLAEPTDDALASTSSIAKMTRELQLRQAQLQERQEAMVGLLAEIDRANLQSATDRVNAAQDALQKMVLGIIGAAALCTGIAVFIIIVYVLRNLVRRMEMVTLGIDRLEAGNLSGPIHVKGQDEIAKMGTALESLRAKSVALREAELALKNSQKNLEKSNTDRDRFAHAAAHDLRAPLRGIRNIAEFIADDLGDGAQEKTRRHLEIMRGRIARLDELLESLLEYTRAGSIRPDPENCLLSELLDDCIVHLPQELAHVDIRCEEGSVLTWREPLAQILRQLLDNAVKHNDHHPARLQLDCRLQRRSVRVRVIDDGPGIEPRFHKSIFSMFQTLQPRDDVEGSGMGLAIAQKLVQSYGGRILVESDPTNERGATFIVNWPIDNEVRESND